MGIRYWLEQSPATRSALVGFANGVAFVFLPYGLELTVLLAMMMPGVYWGFAYIHDGGLEVVEESMTLLALMALNLYCLCQVWSFGGEPSNPYYAPLAVFVHGMVDALHHFGLFPSSKHVHLVCPKYPVMCGSLDVAFAVAMALTIWVMKN